MTGKGAEVQQAPPYSSAQQRGVLEVTNERVADSTLDHW